MLNKRRRFEAFLRNHSPYEPKCKRMKGNPRSWYICEKTKEWHDDQCLGCRHNLITEYRKGTDYRRGGRFYYCCYPRVVNETDEYGKIPDWAAAPNQNNHRIIRAFLQLQKERGFVCRPELEARCQDPEGHADVYVRDFRGNFTSMKTDAGKSHGKVFRDDGYNITICTEVLATLEQYRSLFEA